MITLMNMVELLLKINTKRHCWIFGIMIIYLCWVCKHLLLRFTVLGALIAASHLSLVGVSYTLIN